MRAENDDVFCVDHVILEQVILMNLFVLTEMRTEHRCFFCIDIMVSVNVTFDLLLLSIARGTDNWH